MYLHGTPLIHSLLQFITMNTDTQKPQAHDYTLALLVLLFLIACLAATSCSSKPTQPALDLPEEFSQATPNDTMDAVYDNDTLYITFKGKHR